MGATIAPTMRQQAHQQLSDYLDLFPAERQRLQALRLQLDEDPHDPLSRANMRGHVTTSAIVLDAAGARVLMIQHRIIGRWLQPGGHYEPGQSLWDSACREVREETGLQSLRAHPLWPAAVPLDIDSHAIAANPRKGEGAHWHHDYAYLLQAADDDAAEALQAQEQEVAGVAWWPLPQLAGQGEARFDAVLAKLKALGLDAG